MRVKQGVKILNIYDNHCDLVNDQEYYVSEHKDHKGITQTIIVGQRVKKGASIYMCSCDEVNKAVKIAKLLNQDNGGKDETNAK